MSIYDQNHNLIQQQLTPPDKRSETMLAWERCLVKPIQWVHDLFFIEYANGSDYPVWEISTLYTKGSRVVWNQAVYESIVDNTGNTPVGNEDDQFWVLILDDFRGANERATYNGQKLALEWILNRWFMTTFRQPIFDDSNPPDYYNGARSDFYIDELIVNPGYFLVGQTSPNTSFVSANSRLEYQSFHIPNMYPGSNAPADFQINYPLSLISGGPTDPLYKQMYALVNKYKLAGTTPKYVGY